MMVAHFYDYTKTHWIMHLKNKLKNLNAIIGQYNYKIILLKLCLSFGSQFVSDSSVTETNIWLVFWVFSSAGWPDLTYCIRLYLSFQAYASLGTLGNLRSWCSIRKKSKHVGFFVGTTVEGNTK